MAQELALIRWTDTGIVLDPNHDDFGVPTWVIHALRGAPGEPRRSIKAGVLECQRCVEINRPSTSVYLRRRGQRLIVAHHKSDAGPCYKPESPEHLALKERVASCAQNHGFGVLVEASTADRRGRADVEVIGPSGLHIGHEVQISAVTTSVLARRNNIALRDGRVPSWLTTNKSAHSATRNLIDRVPWAMSNRLQPEQIKKGRPIRVMAGLSRLQFIRCVDLPGMCPDNPQTRFCSGFHTQWDNVAVAVEDFVGYTASGLYIPVALPTDRSQTLRRWVTPVDRDLFVQATGHPLIEDRPAPLRGEPARGQRSWDSRLHQGEKEDRTRRRRSAGRADVREVTQGPQGKVIVGTVHELPDGAVRQFEDHVPAQRQSWETGPDRSFQRWLESGVSVSHTDPCRTCGAVPTRPYLPGRRCFDHAPNPYTSVT